MAAANPYMRDALMDNMAQDTAPQPMRKTAGGSYTAPEDPNTDPYAPTRNAARARVANNPYNTPALEADFMKLATPAAETGAPPTSTAPTFPDGKVDATTPSTTTTTDAPSTTQTRGNAALNYAGFNTQRAQDPTTSAKDAFYAASQQADWMPNSKAEAEQWFNQYIKDALVKAGFTVDWVQGDKAFVRTRENPQGEEIDFLQQAGAPDAALAWQSNMAGQTTGGGGGTSNGLGITSPTLNPALSNNNVLDQINAQITSLMGAGLSLEQIQALINQGAGGQDSTGMTPQV